LHKCFIEALQPPYCQTDVPVAQLKYKEITIDFHQV